MKARKFCWLLVLIPLSAEADEIISIRPGYGDRYVIEDITGRNIGTIRPLTDDTLIIEDPNGRDLGTIRHDGEIDLDDLCGPRRNSLSCVLKDEDDSD